jgi:hypothetical protein
LQIFAGWDQAYFATFLEPHQFLDRLVKAFPVPEWKENSAALQRLAGGIVDSLASGGAFPTSFYWLHADGLPPQSGYCSLPEHWLRLPDVDAELQRYSYRERMVKRQSGERMYLLQARLAVPADLLRRK